MADTKVPQKTYPAEYLAGCLIGGLIIGVLVSWLWFDLGMKEQTADTAKATSTPQASTTKEESTGSTGATTSLPTGSSLLVIDDQPAGTSVAVARAVVTEGQWVVVHEDRGGQPGNALGAARFVGGVQTGFVYLLRATIAGNKYHGLIYKDDGDRVFSMERDTPVSESGKPVDVVFTAN